MGEKITSMHPACGINLGVRQEKDGSWYTTQACPEGIPVGTVISVLQQRCGNCVYRNSRVAIISTTGELKTPAAAAAAAASAVPAAPPMPAVPMVGLPGLTAVPATPPVPPAAPAPAPAPLASPAPVTAAPAITPPAPAASPIAAIPVLPPPVLPPPAPVATPVLPPGLPDLAFLAPTPGATAAPAPPLQQESGILMPMASSPVVDLVNLVPEELQPSEGNQVPVAEIRVTPPRLPDTAEGALAGMCPPAELVSPPVAETIQAQAAQVELAPPALPAAPAVAGQIPWLATLPKGGEADVDVEGVCHKFSEELGLATSGPSWGGISPHMLMDAACWRRAYLRYVLGLVPVKKPEYLLFGTLYHAVMALRYTRADKMFELLDAVGQAGAPKMAGEVRTLVEYQGVRFGQEEWDTWCPRAVEHNMISWLPPQRIGKTRVRIPLATRADLIVGIKRKDEAHPAPGAYASGVYILDWKHSSHITSDLVTGYGMDFQFNTMLSIFTLGRHDQILGPLKGIIVHIASRKEKIDDDSFFRDRLTYKPQSLVQFMSQQLVPKATDFYTKMGSNEARAATGSQLEDVWPEDHRQCKAPFKCPYFDFCDRGMLTGGAVGYKQDVKRIIDVQSWEKPPAGFTVFIPQGLRVAGVEAQDTEEETGVETSRPGSNGSTDAATAAAIAADKTGRRRKPSASDEDVEAAQNTLADAYIAVLADPSIPESLRKEKFLKPGHTVDKVAKALADTMKEVYAREIEAATQFTITFYACTMKKGGISWSSSGKRGTVTWKQLAEAICRRSWFSMDAVMPNMGPASS